ncbi:DnaD domain-containing protein [Lentibacillus sediminis]|uniref:DnaD domain-containing protein n=1 Tax=Lentibacillus sediminis TaxID=1940529 RepID=UPI000C1BEDAC|nr:DnaD domain protein [Lentibacillus sediminis]
MNYMKEINAFHVAQETNPLTTAAAHLWSVLMHVNNRAGWKKEFTVAASLLAIKAALTDSTFKRARQELQEKGYIKFTSQGANKAAVYEMVSLVTFTEEEAAANHSNETAAGTTDDVADRSVNHTMNHTADPLIKQNERKPNQTKQPAADALAFFQENYGGMSPFVAEEIMNWVNDVGDPLVLLAMKRSLEGGKKYWSYAKGILQAWMKKGITTVEEAKAEEQEFKRKQQQKQPRSYGKKPYHAEQKAVDIVPDWFEEHKRQEKLRREKQKREEAQVDPETLHTEVKRSLASLSRKKDK